MARRLREPGGLAQKEEPPRKKTRQTAASDNLELPPVQPKLVIRAASIRKKASEFHVGRPHHVDGARRARAYNTSLVEGARRGISGHGRITWLDLRPTPARPRKERKTHAATSGLYVSQSPATLLFSDALPDVSSSLPHAQSNVRRRKVCRRVTIRPLHSSNSIFSHKRDHHYQQEFLAREKDFLQLWLETEAPPNHLCCTRRVSGVCSDPPATALWRCPECFGSPLSCSGCLVHDHALYPYHHVERWNREGECFEKTSLMEAGYIISCGHKGQLCPAYIDVPANPNVPPDGPDAVNEPPEDENENEWEDLHQPLSPREFLDTRRDTERLFTIVHANGLHRHWVRFCKCSQAISEWRQLLQLRIWPATLQRPQTGFTMDCLRDAYLHNVECKTSMNAYHTKLQKQTHQGPITKFKV